MNQDFDRYSLKLTDYFNNNKNHLSFVNSFWGIRPSERDLKDIRDFHKVLVLHSQRMTPRKISGCTGISKRKVEHWIYGNSLPRIVRLLINYIGVRRRNGKVLSINSTRGGLFNGPWIVVPGKVTNYNDIVKVLNRLTPLKETYTRGLLFGISKDDINKVKPLLFAYLLGVLIGDAGKDRIKRAQRITRRITLMLTKFYETNYRFGGFVCMCANSLGLRMHQTKDMPAGKKNRHPFYSWRSQCSPLIQWVFSTCLGLNDGQLTTYNPVDMRWILSAPKDFKIWFIQGLADSDGFVDMSSQQTGIITHPNTELIESVLNSLGIPASRKLFTSNGLWSLMIDREESYNLPILNTYVKSYRYDKLERLFLAKRISGHWPAWLKDKIDNYTKIGLSGTKVVEKILENEGIAIRAQHVNRRIKRLCRGDNNREAV